MKVKPATVELPSIHCPGFYCLLKMGNVVMFVWTKHWRGDNDKELRPRPNPSWFPPPQLYYPNWFSAVFPPINAANPFHLASSSYSTSLASLRCSSLGSCWHWLVDCWTCLPTEGLWGIRWNTCSTTKLIEGRQRGKPMERKKKKVAISNLL